MLRVSAVLRPPKLIQKRPEFWGTAPIGFPSIPLSRSSRRKFTGPESEGVASWSGSSPEMNDSQVPANSSGNNQPTKPHKSHQTNPAQLNPTQPQRNLIQSNPIYQRTSHPHWVFVRVSLMLLPSARESSNRHGCFAHFLPHYWHRA